MSEPPSSWGQPPDSPQSWGTPPPPQQPTWQQPGSQSYAPPPGAPAYGPPPPTSRSKLPWILAAAGVILVLVAVGLVLLLRGDGSETDPESAAETFVAALQDGDCEAYTAMTTQRFQDTYGSCEGDLDTADLLGSSGVTIVGDVSVTDETDDTATAEVQVSFAGFSLPLQLQMVGEGQGWLVDDLTIAGFGLDDIPSDPGQLPN